MIGPRMLRKLPVASAYLILAFFIFLMLRITLPYFLMDDHTGFLMVKQAELQYPWWRVAFYTHVFVSVLALLAGFTQFSVRLRTRYSTLHRQVGKVYVTVVLFLSAPSGLLLAFYARGGLISSIAFSILALLWFYFTLRAFIAAKEKRFAIHREMMIRSYALTLSAVTLRAWKWAIVLIFHPRPIDVYIIIAWLGFIPNLLVAEWLIRRIRSSFRSSKSDVEPSQRYHINNQPEQGYSKIENDR